MYRSPPTAIRHPQRMSNHVRDTPSVGHHPRTLSNRTRHSHLVDLLHRAAPKLAEFSGAAYRQQRAFRVHRVCQAGNSVGKARRGVHSNARLASDAAPCVRHVRRRLLVPRINEPKAHVRHAVQCRKHVVARNREHILHAFERQRPAYKLAPAHHARSRCSHLLVLYRVLSANRCWCQRCQPVHVRLF